MQKPFGRKTNNPSQLGLRSSTSAPGEIITHNLNVYRLVMRRPPIHRPPYFTKQINLYIILYKSRPCKKNKTYGLIDGVTSIDIDKRKTNVVIGPETKQNTQLTV